LTFAIEISIIIITENTSSQ